MSSWLVPVQKRAGQKEAIKEGRVGQGSRDGNESSQTVTHEKEWEVRVFSFHPLAGGQHGNGVLFHPLHLCPASWARSVPNVVVAPAKKTIGSTGLTKTVKIW